MRKLILLGSLFTFLHSNAQNVGIGTNTPVSSAKLDVTSTNSGFLPPRLTTSQRNSIANPVAGLEIWNLDCVELQVYNGSDWTNMIGGVACANVPIDKVPICSQIWMSKNLDVSTYRNGDPVPQVTDPASWAALTTGAWCWYNNDSTTYAATYGKLYNWYAVNDERGLVPNGWHIPSLNEWTDLYNCVNANNCPQCPSSVGTHMKETGYLHWQAGSSYSDNSTGFTGLPGGYRYSLGSFNNIGNDGFWWTTQSNSNNNANAFYRGLNYNSQDLLTYEGDKRSGLSVRCINDNSAILTLPTVITSSASAITTMSATCGGNVTNVGGAGLHTYVGICWSTSANPTIDLITKTSEGYSTGVYTSYITGLTPNTTYHVRAYAINSVGVAYGADSIFTTLQAVVANLPNVTICNQVWTSKNLDVDHYRNGDLIPKVTDNDIWAGLTTGGYCYYNNDSATYAAVYGKLYNWYAVNDSRGLAPTGWHVPSDAEWNILVKCLDTNADTTVSEGQAQSSTVGIVLKEVGFTHWNQTLAANPTNSSGFKALPGAYRASNGPWGDPIGNSAYFWSSSVYPTFPTSDAFSRGLFAGNNNLYKFFQYKNSGLSIRLVKD